jgi:hypothetical protein
MEIKLIFKNVLFVICLFLCIANVAHAESELKVLGTSPFSQYELKSVDDLQQMVESLRSDLKNGFERVGTADLFEGFVTQVNQGNVETVEVQPGQKMEWMIFRNARAVKVITDLVWAGDEPFTAYQLDVDKSGTRYSFIIPVICGNVALAQASTVPASDSAPVPVTAPQETATPAASPPAVVEPDRGHFVADIGVMYMDEPVTYLPVRVGYDYRFCDYFSLLGLVGYAPVIHGKGGLDDGAIMADLLGVFRYGRMFLGAGAGYWHSDLSEHGDGIAELGYVIFGEPKEQNVSLFVEGRSAFDELDHLEKGRIGAGVRFQF